VAIGLFDETCPPVGVHAACNLIKGPKEVVLMNSGHHDQNGSQAPYNRRAEEWLAAMVKGEQVRPQ